MVPAMRRTVLSAAVLLVAAGTSVQAGPHVRGGVTYGLVDETAPGQHQVAPFVALGARAGRIVGEVDYAYLSFMEPDSTRGGVHRLGATLRADLYRNENKPCVWRLACTKAMSVYGSLGAGMRYGQWLLDAHRISPNTDRQREAHVGIGIELDNEVAPFRHGWQFGLRFVVAPRGAEADALCRGTCAMTTAPNSYDRAIFFEWSALIGQ